MYLWSVNLVLLPMLCAFLLEPNNQQNSTGVSGAKSSTAKIEQQHRDTEALRKTVADTLSILTSQLHDKFVDFERKLINGDKQNETSRAVEKLEKKLLELEQNYTVVLSELKLAKDDNTKMKTQFSLLMNKTRHVDERMNNIEQLKNIQSLQDIQAIKQQIQTINSQTASLSQNQFARNQDFLALYNQTSVGFVHAVTRLQHLESFENVSLTNTKTLEDRLQDLEAKRNMSIMITTRLTTKTEALQTQITNIKRKVAIEACQAHDQSQPSGYIVKFDNVKTSIGISGISSFISSRKFKCEYEGLYIVSVSLTAYDIAIKNGIYLNGKEYTGVYELDNKVHYQRGTTTVIVNLHPNDMLWVKLQDHMYVDQLYSCIAIVMIK
ncbi:unnamed protein product [Mytilus coruscus]|uniref:C1q domain-containing protein n=1 Tax=Mytilus coruscus TaxID=42192 RepID=A0A6J8BLE0_MYTCO|nr:unnamed protein product [Mytilus coruscus]